MRGEYHQTPMWPQTQSGTTSACAENTHARDYPLARTGNYLRVRGEYIAKPNWSYICLELPPRARRIPWVLGVLGCVLGTTSACAENTRMVAIRCPAVRNYLRVRGEYLSLSILNLSILELPPRARRILTHNPRPLLRAGTTSACAENTVR